MNPLSIQMRKGRVAVFWVPALGTKACPLTFKPSLQYIERKAIAEPGMMGC